MDELSGTRRKRQRSPIVTLHLGDEHDAYRHCHPLRSGGRRSRHSHSRRSRSRRRLWRNTAATVVLMSMLLSCTPTILAAPGPAVVLPGEQTTNDQPNRINSPNRYRETKIITSSTGSSAGSSSINSNSNTVTDSMTSKSSQNKDKPNSAQFPTPQKDQQRSV